MKNIIVLFLSILITTSLKSQDCNKPFAISFQNNAQDSVTVRWLQSGGTPLGFQIAYGLRGTSINNTTKSDTFVNKFFTLNGLSPATQYIVFVRTICDENSNSGWNGPFAFTTHFNNPTDCSTHIALQDENCDFGGETFFIDIDNPGILGSDIFIESVDILLEHPWLADIEIILENPAGSQSILSQFNGAAQNNFGIVNETCDTITRFSSNACISITEGTAPFIGVYSPISSLVSLNDGTSAKGLWKLHLCDRSAGDKGILRQLKLNLTPQLCEPIVDFYISEIKGNTVKLNWIAPFNCESIVIEYGEEGFQQGVGQGIIKQLNCKREEVIIDDLDPQTSYDFYLLGDCITSIAAPSCKSSFTTDCDAKTIQSDFDNLTICQNSCAVRCQLGDPVWYNEIDNEIDWLIWSGNTDTENTGPTADINREGNYIYVESSPSICGVNQTASIISHCFYIGSDPACGIGFSYHMEGNDQGDLTLQVSSDFGNTWQSLFNASKTSGWDRINVSLDEFIDQYVTFKFEAVTSGGEEGDIAIDQIDFHGTIENGENTIYFDSDEDGYGIEDSSLVICGPIPKFFALEKGDCNDGNNAIHPGVPEIGCNAIDENCNGLEDDNPEPPIITLDTLQSESCFGLNDGILDLDIEGNETPYTILWNNGMEGNRLENIPTGFYRATITDVSSCATVTPFYEVPVESKIDIELVSVLNSTCTGRRDGELTILPTGGVEPYTYEWPFDQIQATVIGLIQGDYVVTVTDAEGCIKISEPYHVGVNKPLNVGTTLHKNVSCYGGGDGRLEINASNGQQPYEYRWQGGHTNNVIDNLFPGIYKATVTDKIGCEAIYSNEITQPDSLYQILLNIESIKCYGDKNGKIKTTTIGGVPPFTYQWNSGHTTDDIFELSSGEYIMEVFDNNGCTSTLDTVILDEPEPLDLGIDSIINTTCRLSNDGAIYLDLNGGVPPYDYFWRRIEADSLSAKNIFSGNYGFTGVDKNDCKISLPGIDVTSGNKSSSIEFEVIQPYKCPNEFNGVIKAIIDSDAQPFNFNWSNGISKNKDAVIDTISSLGPGTYNLTITDSKGCVSISNNIFFNQIEIFKHTVPTFRNNECPYDSAGIIGIDIEGGTSPYMYKWSNEKQTPAIGKLPNGIYQLTITDDNECQYVVQEIEMYSESNLSVRVVAEPTIVDNQSGAIQIIPENGIPNYFITWGDTSLTTFTRLNLESGFYEAMILDQLGCMIDTTIFIDQISSINENQVSKINIFPNPTSSSVFIKGINSAVTIDFFDLSGRKVQTNQLNETGEIDVSKLTKGMYLVRITDSSPHYKTSYLYIVGQ